MAPPKIRTCAQQGVHELLAVINYPVAVFFAGLDRFFGEHDLAFAGDGAFVPFEEATADDFRGFGRVPHEACHAPVTRILPLSCEHGRIHCRVVRIRAWH